MTAHERFRLVASLAEVPAAIAALEATGATRRTGGMPSFEGRLG